MRKYILGRIGRAVLGAGIVAGSYGCFNGPAVEINADVDVNVEAPIDVDISQGSTLSPEDINRMIDEGIESRLGEYFEGNRREDCPKEWKDDGVCDRGCQFDDTLDCRASSY